MPAHHLFAFTNTPEAAAEELLAFGLTEGSNRIHPGQGTRNRKFYFRNFYFEILWMHNEDEIRSPITAPAKLWERANHQTTGYSPFGICLEKSAATDALFAGCLLYKPAYLPPGMAIKVLPHSDTPFLPWTFRLPFPAQPHTSEPTNHHAGLHELTKITFGIPAQKLLQETRFYNLPGIHLAPATEHHLTLQFDKQKQGKTKTLRHLPLTLEY